MDNEGAVESSMNIINLPCGYIAIGADESGGEKQVLLDEVEIREITGYEEDILANKEIPSMRKMSLVMAKCMVSIGNKDGVKITDKTMFEKIVNELPIGDRLFLLISLRNLSTGTTRFRFSVKCAICKEDKKACVDLKDLKIKQPKDKMLRQYDVTLPSGKSVRMRIMTGVHERGLQNINKRYPDSVFSAALSARVVSIEGKEYVDKELINRLKKLSLIDRNYLRSVYDEYEGGIDTEVEVPLEDCSRDDCPGIIKTDIDLGSSDFFFPSQQEENS
jgi:hypothetical protein